MRYSYLCDYANFIEIALFKSQKQAHVLHCATPTGRLGTRRVHVVEREKQLYCICTYIKYILYVHAREVQQLASHEYFALFPASTSSTYCTADRHRRALKRTLPLKRSCLPTPRVTAERGRSTPILVMRTGR